MTRRTHAWATGSAPILLGLIVGLIAGMLASRVGAAGAEQAAKATDLIGGLWLDALTMTVVPLVFSLLVTGIVAAAVSAAADGLVLRALLWFGILLIAACTAGALIVTALLGVVPPPPGLAALHPEGPAPQIAAAGDWLRGLIPTNPVKAAAETAVAPLVIFALAFGLALARIEPQLRDSVDRVFRGVVQAMLVIVQWILRVAPLGVAGLAFGVGARFGVGAIGSLLHYVLLIVLVCLSVTILAYVVVWLAGAVSPATFVKAALPAQVVAVSTQSSLASLPAMIKAARTMDVPDSRAGVVLPMAVAIFRAASAAANIAVAIYLAHLHAIDLSVPTVALGVAVAAVVSLAAVGLPAQVSFFATIGPVCLAMGVPIGLLGLLLAVETLPDLFRTLGNVTSDLAVTRIVGRVRPDKDEIATTV